MHKVINLYAGPGTGKSTCCAALFAELKYRGHNTEMVLEYAKDAAWEKRPRIFEAQDYIFGKQHFRLQRVAEQVEFAITDAPILLGAVYSKPSYLPSLPIVLKEAYDRYDNLDVFLIRKKAYQPKGRNQTEDEAKQIDVQLKQALTDLGIKLAVIDSDRDAPGKIIKLMEERGWL